MSGTLRGRRRRTAGRRKPPGAVCVTRPGRWGNPFVAGRDGDARTLVVYFRECLDRAIRGRPFPAAPNGGAPGDDVMERFVWMAANLSRLRGKHLLCWCRPGDPCHAEVLADLANR